MTRGARVIRRRRLLRAVAVGGAAQQTGRPTNQSRRDADDQRAQIAAVDAPPALSPEDGEDADGGR